MWPQHAGNKNEMFLRIQSWWVTCVGIMSELYTFEDAVQVYVIVLWSSMNLTHEQKPLFMDI